MTAEKTDEIKDLSKAFKNVCDIDHDDNFMEQLAEMPKSSKDVTIQPILQVDDDGFVLYVEVRQGGMILTKMYNVNQVADLLGICSQTVRLWINCGRINGVKLAGSTRWSVSEKEIQRIQQGEKNEHTANTN